MICGNEPQTLRRIMRPYAGQLLICSLVTLGVIFVSIQRHVISLMLPVPVLWLLVAYLVWLGRQYRVVWTNKMVCQRASGGPEMCMEYGQITRVAVEVSTPGELPSASRRYRRIAIYADEPPGEGKFIDVSLKHFSADDIRRLMRTIQIQCPDLELPPHWT